MTTRNQEIDNALKSHDKAITKIQATLSALSKQQEAILKAITEKAGSSSGEGGGSGSAFNTNGADSKNNRSLRIGKIYFPKYAVVHFERDAFQWHRAYLRTRNTTMAEIQWDEYVRSILAHFSKAMFEDPLEELASLNQTGTLHNLNTAFDALLNKVNLTESQAISLYLKAMSLDIRGMVKMFRLSILHEAYGLAKTQALNNEKMEDDDDEETEEIGAETEEKEHHISIHAEEGRRSISQAFQGRSKNDVGILFLIDNMQHDVTRCNTVNQETNQVNESLTIELERYREKVKNIRNTKEPQLMFPSREKDLDSQL
nr:hypothetical protein [Tanacetum cinerariifolium]